MNYKYWERRVLRKKKYKKEGRNIRGERKNKERKRNRGRR